MYIYIYINIIFIYLLSIYSLFIYPLFPIAVDTGGGGKHIPNYDQLGNPQGQGLVFLDARVNQWFQTFISSDHAYPPVFLHLHTRVINHRYTSQRILLEWQTNHDKPVYRIHTSPHPRQNASAQSAETPWSENMTMSLKKQRWFYGM